MPLAAAISSDRWLLFPAAADASGWPSTGKRVLVISHGGALHATHRAAHGFEAQGKVSNCSISVVHAELEGPHPDSCQDCQACQDQPGSCQDSCQDQPGRASCSSSSSGSSSDEDVIMRSSMHSSLGFPASVDDRLQEDAEPAAAVGDYGYDVKQLGAGLGLLFSSTASQGSGCCSSSCCGCCYCMGDECEGGCIGNAYEAYDDEEEEQAAAGQHASLMYLNHQQQRQQQQGSGVDIQVAVGYEKGMQKDSTSAVAAAVKAVFGGTRVVSGKLSMLVWNDTAALFDLEAEEGVGMRAAGFGGSAREA
jgi:hypothetical protein